MILKLLNDLFLIHFAVIDLLTRVRNAAECSAKQRWPSCLSAVGTVVASRNCRASVSSFACDDDALADNCLDVQTASA